MGHINSVGANIFAKGYTAQASSNPIKKQEFMNSAFTGKGPTNLDFVNKRPKDDGNDYRKLWDC